MRTAMVAGLTARRSHSRKKGQVRFRLAGLHRRHRGVPSEACRRDGSSGTPGGAGPVARSPGSGSVPAWHRAATKAWTAAVCSTLRKQLAGPGSGHVAPAQRGALGMQEAGRSTACGRRPPRSRSRRASITNPLSERARRRSPSMATSTSRPKPSSLVRHLGQPRPLHSQAVLPGVQATARANRPAGPRPASPRA